MIQIAIVLPFRRLLIAAAVAAAGCAGGALQPVPVDAAVEYGVGRPVTGLGGVIGGAPTCDDDSDDGAVDAADAGLADGGTDGAAAPDGGPIDGAAPGLPGAFNLFNQIPQFGLYATEDPSYTPPPGILMWDHGTTYVTKLSAVQKTRIGGDVAARVTYHAECDEYDRLGAVFYIVLPPGQVPGVDTARVELVRFVTPFSDRWRCNVAIHVFPDSDISAHARALADPSRDVWVGIAGGSNPYRGDACTNRSVAPELAAVGFKYSVDFISSRPLANADAGGADGGGGDHQGGAPFVAAFYDPSATALPVVATLQNPGGAVTGHVTVIVSGHGSDAGGAEYRSTADLLLLNGAELGTFDSGIDCAPYAASSPDGNPGIFRNNRTSNHRNWCPGALVPPHTFAATLLPGTNTLTLQMTPGDVPSGSYYAASITFTSP